MLDNAPEEYKDQYALWNSVELVEKSKDAQLARTTYRIELPNESYDLAKEVMRIIASGILSTKA